MKCPNPNCGYDKIQPRFNVCPKCGTPLKKEVIDNSSMPDEKHVPNEKWWGSRLISGWTYEKAMSNPYKYAVWALDNPNDNRVFLEKWNKAGYDLTLIRKAIAEANRARQENPTVDREEVGANIIDSTQQTIRSESNRSFVQAVNADYTTDAATIVRNKAIWKLQTGELARHIAPDEWVYVSEHLEGLVIEEGTSAIIYIDGQEVTQMSSGMYVFDSKHTQAARLEAERRENNHQGTFSSIADSIYRFFTGHKREENTRQREERRRRVQQIMGRLKKDTIIDVYLKSERIFPAIFGQQHFTDSSEVYQPYTIQSRHIDIKVGVSMQMRIGNFKDFIANYMAGKKSVSIVDVVKSIDSSVASILRYRLRDVEVSERGLDELTFNAIKNHLKQNLPNILHGIIVIDVLDITTSNEQLARFRQVEEQLFCSEREYDFLLRTNEFRNRIASEENDQKIREARSEQELRFRLDEVNKDQLLHDDEMEQFVSLLMNQKIIREASNKADLEKALLEIQRNVLITKEEFDIFREDLENRRFDREQVSEQLRARSLMATAILKLDIDKTLQIANIENAEEISEAEWEAFRNQKGREAESWDLEATIYGRKFILEQQQLANEAERRHLQNEADAEALKGKQQLNDFERNEKLKDHEIDEKLKNDDFNRIQREKEYEYQRQLRDSEDALKRLQQMIEIEENQKDSALRRDLEQQRMQAELNLTQLKEQHAFELEQARLKEETEKAKIQTESTMSAEQLLGKNIAQMDATAQAKFAESFSHLKEIELTKANAQQQNDMYEKMVAMAQANGVNIQQLQASNNQQQMAFMQQVLSAITQMSASQAAGQQGLVSSLVNAMQDVASGKIKDSQLLKEEYRDEKHYAEGRLDENQKQSLNYTTRVSVSENLPSRTKPTAVNISVNNNVCPSCGEPLDDDMNICPICQRRIK